MAFYSHADERKAQSAAYWSQKCLTATSLSNVTQNGLQIDCDTEDVRLQFHVSFEPREHASALFGAGVEDGLSFTLGNFAEIRYDIITLTSPPCGPRCRRRMRLSSVGTPLTWSRPVGRSRRTWRSASRRSTPFQQGFMLLFRSEDLVR